MKTKIRLLMTGATLFAATLPAAAADEPQVEVITSWTSGGEAGALDVIREAFETRGGVWNNSSLAGFGAADAAFQNRLVAGDPPDAKQGVMGLANENLVEAGMLSPIDDIARNGDWQGVLPKSVFDLISYDGKVYLAPTGVHGESWVFYSKAAFEKAGITSEPETWDALFSDLDALKAAGVLPVAWGGQSWQEAKVFNMILLSQVGIDGFNSIYIDKDQSEASVTGVEKTLEIMRKLRAYVDEGAPGRNWNDATSMLITGTAGVQFMGDWAKGEFAAAGQVAGEDYGCMIAPESHGMVYVGDSFLFPEIKDDAEKQGQALLAEIAMDPAVQAGFAEMKGAIPVRTDLDMSGFDLCTQKGAALMAENAIVPDQAMVLTPQQAGALSDFVGAYWNDDSQSPEKGAKQFFAIFL